ncbi:hypothetical protein B0A55_04133 [Friedmanniomyces simplex]|uniref:Uncharacterized protein n=1 Tax=Friedmanniomyces simplex TaxID=329884 RepID=A0A4U0XN39_9PEZI|nr:hypothetical protein B0A55_04133 [Friedmanniomyces simplex]
MAPKSQDRKDVKTGSEPLTSKDKTPLTAEQRQAKAAKAIAALKRDGLTTSLKKNDDHPDGHAAAAAADAVLAEPTPAAGTREESPEEGEIDEAGQDKKKGEDVPEKPKTSTSRSTRSSSAPSDEPTAALDTAKPRTIRCLTKRSSDQSSAGEGTAKAKSTRPTTKTSPQQSTDKPKPKTQPKTSGLGIKSRKTRDRDDILRPPKSTPLSTLDQAANARIYQQRLDDLNDRIFADNPPGDTLILGVFATAIQQLTVANLGLETLLQDYFKGIVAGNGPTAGDDGDGDDHEHDDQNDNRDERSHGGAGGDALEGCDGLGQATVNTVTETAADDVAQNETARAIDESAETTIAPRKNSLRKPSHGSASDETATGQLGGSAVDEKDIAVVGETHEDGIAPSDVVLEVLDEAATSDLAASEAAQGKATALGTVHQEVAQEEASQQVTQELQDVQQDSHQQDQTAGWIAPGGYSETESEIVLYETAPAAGADNEIKEPVTPGAASSSPSDGQTERSPKRSIDQVDEDDEVLLRARSPKQAKYQAEPEQPDTTQSVQPAADAGQTDSAAVNPQIAGLLDTFTQYPLASTGQSMQRELEVSPTYSTGNPPANALAEMHENNDHLADSAGDTAGHVDTESGNGADADALNTLLESVADPDGGVVSEVDDTGANITGAVVADAPDVPSTGANSTVADIVHFV